MSNPTTARKTVVAATGRTRKPATEAVQPTYMIHSLGEYEVSTKVTGRIAKMSEAEAREITDQIQHTMNRLWLLVTEAHDRKAHEALGYKTWADYVKAELGMSESRSYQFLDTGHVMKAIAAGGGDIEAIPVPPTRVVARVKDSLKEVTKATEQALANPDDDPGKAVDKAIRALARIPQVGTGNGGSRGAARAEAEVEPEAAPVPEGQVPCPACAGIGRVTEEAAERILEALQSLE